MALPIILPVMTLMLSSSPPVNVTNADVLNFAVFVDVSSSMQVQSGNFKQLNSAQLGGDERWAGLVEFSHGQGRAIRVGHDLDYPEIVVPALAYDVVGTELTVAHHRQQSIKRPVDNLIAELQSPRWRWKEGGSTPAPWPGVKTASIAGPNSGPVGQDANSVSAARTKTGPTGLVLHSCSRSHSCLGRFRAKGAPLYDTNALTSDLAEKARGESRTKGIYFRADNRRGREPDFLTTIHDGILIHATLGGMVIGGTL
jgi:hypothetical protein